MKSEECRRVQAFEMWLWRRMEKIKWTDKVTNDSVLATVNEKYTLIEKVKKIKKIMDWSCYKRRRSNERSHGLKDGKKENKKKKENQHAARIITSK